MSNISGSRDLSGVNGSRQLEVLVVQSNPADTALTLEAFKVAGLKDAGPDETERDSDHAANDRAQHKAKAS